jgi:hypothetical protein
MPGQYRTSRRDCDRDDSVGDRNARGSDTHRQGIDVADPAMVEIAGSGMVNGMALAPVVIGRERYHAQDSPDPVGRRLRKKEPWPQSC